MATKLKMVVGSVVALKSQKHMPMTVRRLNGEDVACIWFDHTQTLKHETFKTRDLTVIRN